MSEDLKEIIRQRLKDYMTAYGTGDVSRVAALYTQDCYYIPPERRFIRGRQAIIKCGILKQMMDLGGKRLQINDADFVIADNSVSVVGTYSLFDEDENEIDDGRLINVWVKVEDQWLLKYDMFN